MRMMKCFSLVVQTLSLSLLPGLRRSLSEGFLLVEPRSPRFLSDSTIHRLLRPTLDLKPVPYRPSVQTLRKHLTQEGGSLNQMLLLLNGTKVESSEDQTSEDQQTRPVQNGREKLRARPGQWMGTSLRCLCSSDFRAATSGSSTSRERPRTCELRVKKSWRRLAAKMADGYVCSCSQGC